ncbi:MAG: C45 family autoproteolytic acyltransferase/hydrolase [Candidatus Binatia bacterium]
MRARDATKSDGSRRFPRLLLVALWLGGSACALGYATRIVPPRLALPVPEEVRYDGATAYVGPAYLARRGKLWVMHVEGAPEQLGYRHARLATPLMTEGDRRMLDLFATFVPSVAFRWALTGFVRLRYRNLDAAFPSTRRAEIFGEAAGYEDRFADFLPTYQRLVYLHGLYDIALAFERSPLLGCTAFAASGPTTANGASPGHTIVGRNFDLEIDPWFDTDKVVQIVEPEAGLAFASVAWPGMTGVVTGINAAGIWVSVNGGRASDTRSGGVPVVFTTRAVLEGARSLAEALAIISRDEPMVSHILLLADGKTGESMIVERAPGHELGIVRHPSAIVLANHFRTSPLRDDPKDARLRDITSSEARHTRMAELVARHHGRIDPAVAAAMLRDRFGPGDAAVPLGNRNAVDALVATHSVVADLTARVLWVSEGPNTLGAYRKIDLAARLETGESAADGETAGDLAADPILDDGTYERYRRGGRVRRAAERLAAEGELEAAAELYRRALRVRGDDHVSWRGLALVEENRGNPETARTAWARVLELAPDTPEVRREAEAHVRGH